MRWSKLKQRVEERFAPEAVGRVEVHVTRYHRANDREGELFVTLDGTKTYGASDWNYFAEKYGNAFNSPNLKNWKPMEEDDDDLLARGIWSQHELIAGMSESLNQTIDDMLASPHPLIRALAILDVRCGQRRLAKLDLEIEHELVVRFHGLRTAGHRASLDTVQQSHSRSEEASA
ncbi:hypothetical protein C3941_04495 [Kaistia algarum]|uniref:SF0329 family protein n=1 Tax=Kaistia algarum TaxID=2083279 RepID=UPI000CE7B974|nr:hypothetical protein [Kaistia algarum]MCX5512524.1 hypothetical protein [Kaistia algarum]PPE81947.1 hypothetical protein C3941_04495 [Kaistia algarum]